MIKNSTRYNRLVDSNTDPDVDGSYEIRFSLKATGNASKSGSFRPVLSSYGMAIGAFPAGVAWIDHDDGNACFPCLVFYERPELVERPRIVDVHVSFPNVVLILIPLRSSMAIAEEVPLASCTISLDITWLVFLMNLLSFPESFFI